mgnify:CR=1 FL=1
MEPRTMRDLDLPHSLDVLLTPEDIVSSLNLPTGVQGVYELSRARARDPLPVLKIGKYLRVRRADFDSWLERQRRARR